MIRFALLALLLTSTTALGDETAPEPSTPPPPPATVESAPEPAASPTPNPLLATVPPAAAPASPGKKAAVVAFGAAYGVLAIVGAAIFGYGTVHGDNGNNDSTLAARAAQIQNGKDFNVAGAVVWGVAGVMGLTSFIIAVTPNSKKTDKVARYWIAPSAGAVQAGGTF